MIQGKFRNLIVNISIVFMLIIIAAVGFSNEVSQVFSNSKLKAYYNGNTSNNNVSLMINVYWGTEYLEGMLDIFKKYNVSATFFVGGLWAGENEKLLKRFIDDGHEIGNHGYYHKDHDKIGAERNEEEIYITHQLVFSLTGYTMNLFAPPSGAFNDVTLEVADKLGYKTIMWSKDTIDWRDKDTTLIYNRATANAKNGELILMHPTKNTLEALENIITFYNSNEFELVTVSKNIEGLTM